MLSNKGQSLIGIIIVLVVVGLIGGGLYYYLQKQIPEVGEIPESPPEEVTPEEEVVTPLEEELPKEEVIPDKKPIIQKCSDGTLYGQCSLNKPKYCDNGNLINKASLCGCSTGYKISNNQCVAEIACQNECSSVDSKGCVGNGYQICGNYDEDSCLEWGPITSCSEGRRCERGNCLVINSPKSGVEYWAVIAIPSSYPAPSEEAAALTSLNLSTDIKNRLLERDWQENHIKSLSGKDASWSMRETNLKTALSWLRENSDSDDVILLIIQAHGSEGGIIRLEGEDITYSEIAEELETIKYGGFLAILHSCFGETAFPALKKENRIIMIPSQLPISFHKAIFGFGDIEGNNNGWVSAEEIYNYYRLHELDWGLDLSSIQDDYPGELNIIFLNDDLRYLDQYNIRKSLPADMVGGVLQNVNGWIAQSFVPNYPILTKVVLGIDTGTHPGPLVVSIREELSGSDLTSVTLPENSFDYPKTWLLREIDLPDTQVIPGKTYYIVIKAPYAAYPNKYTVQISQNDYPKGKIFQFNNLIWGTNAPTDLFFATFGKIK